MVFDYHGIIINHYAVVIQNNPHLATLSLASLQTIENGGLHIGGNPQLCLVDTLTQTLDSLLNNSDLLRVGGLGAEVCDGK